MFEKDKEKSLRYIDETCMKSAQKCHANANQVVAGMVGMWIL